MDKSIINTVLQQQGIAILIDPDKTSIHKLDQIIANTANKISCFLVGGSLLQQNNTSEIITYIKTHTQLPVILFPGNGMQINATADAILLLSLISGRNPDLLIGQQVQYAGILKQSKLEIIPTGYILIDGGKTTTVAYISNTTPIPPHKPDIVQLTALAGIQLGLQCIYLEAGSGALHAVPETIVSSVKATIGNIPLIVGGGIRTHEQITACFNAGAQLVVIGTAIEEGILNL